MSGLIQNFFNQKLVSVTHGPNLFQKLGLIFIVLNGENVKQRIILHNRWGKCVVKWSLATWSVSARALSGAVFTLHWGRWVGVAGTQYCRSQNKTNPLSCSVTFLGEMRTNFSSPRKVPPPLEQRNSSIQVQLSELISLGRLLREACVIQRQLCHQKANQDMGEDSQTGDPWRYVHSLRVIQPAGVSPLPAIASAYITLGRGLLVL